jgi:pilus assembly protein CpaB
MRLSRSTLILGLALVMGMLAALAIHHTIERRLQDIDARATAGGTLRVLVPKTDLARGTPLTSKVVAVREVPAEWVHSNAVTPDQFERIENQRLAHPAMRGETLLWSLLEAPRAPSFASRLRAGRRAITVPVDEVSSISGMIEPGDRIDLLAAVRKDQRAVLFALLQDVTVLATGARAGVEADGRDGRRSYTTLTLEAAADDAQRVLAAREMGKLAAVLRAPGDRATQSSARRDALTLLGLGDPAALPDEGTVPVLYGNRAGLPGELPRLRTPRDMGTVASDPLRRPMP